MSQYRDDRGAARLRIEALEARLAEREAELARSGAALADRDEEIDRLQRELELAGGLGPRHVRSVNAAWASRIVGVATCVAVMAAGAGIALTRSPAPPPLPSVVVVELQAPPIHADPLAPGVDWSWPPSESPQAAPTAAPSGAPSDEAQVRRQLEPRVWGGRASKDEIRMLKAICSHEGDHACRERARAELERARALDP